MYTEIIVRLLIITALSGLIGYERETRKDLVRGTAGLRTHILVGLGATLLVLLTIYSFPVVYGTQADLGRLASYIVMGIGFLGAGTIMGMKGKLIGLTTAASIWLVAAIGISIGLGAYFPALLTTAIALIVLELWRFEKKLPFKEYK
jgi:putative Mg2+ transporter-C (MgtC) family protein